MYIRIIKLVLLFLTSGVILGCHTMTGSQATAGMDFASHNEEKQYFAVAQPNAPRSFPDIGSALAWRGSQCVLHQTAFDGSATVLDYYTGEEILISEAFFVSSTGIRTPSGHTIIAFKDKINAEKFLTSNHAGTIKTFSEILDEDMQ